jgi:hypothetical protein
LITGILFYDVVLWVHIVAVLIAFGGVFTYPVWFGMIQRWQPTERAMFHRAQATLGKFVISPFLLLIILAGAYLASDRDYWSEVWVTVPLVIAIILGGMGGAYFGPREDRLAELADVGGGAEYERLFVQVRNVAYLAMLLVLVAAFFMVTKLGA